MDEPLIDWVTVVAAFLGVAAVLTLRVDESVKTNADRVRQQHCVGLLLLTLCVGALMSRWVESLMALPLAMRPPVGRQVILAAVCGFGIAAAILSVTASTVAARMKSFLAVVANVVLALIVAAAWKWAALLIALLASGAYAAVVSYRRINRRAGEVKLITSSNQRERPLCDRTYQADAFRPPTDDTVPREPALVLITAVGLLLLLLGTWQHVVSREGQRTTRSQRYSAWPRVTALKDAWERTGWVAKADEKNSTQTNAESVQRVTVVAAREQRIAWGLGALLLVVAGVAWRQATRPFGSTSHLSVEVEHVG